MRKTFGAALAALALSAAPAAASDAATVTGTTCGLAAVETFHFGQVTFEGAVFGAVAATDSAAPTALTTVELICSVLVHGKAYPSLTISSGPMPTVAVAAGRVTFVADPSIVVTVCTEVRVNGVQRYRSCDPTTRSDIPPHEVCDPVAPTCDTPRPQIVCDQVQDACYSTRLRTIHRVPKELV